MGDENTACVFNCQMGKGRTTIGMIVACLIRDVLSSDVPSYPLLQADKNELPDEEEFLDEQHRFGNFEVLDKLYQYLPEAKEGKAHLDHIIDLCGTPKEGGTGLQNLRECIVWTEANVQKFYRKILLPHCLCNISQRKSSKGI